MTEASNSGSSGAYIGNPIVGLGAVVGETSPDSADVHPETVAVAAPVAVSLTAEAPVSAADAPASAEAAVKTSGHDINNKIALQRGPSVIHSIVASIIEKTEKAVGWTVEEVEALWASVTEKA